MVDLYHDWKNGVILQVQLKHIFKDILDCLRHNIFRAINILWLFAHGVIMSDEVYLFSHTLILLSMHENLTEKQFPSPRKIGVVRHTIRLLRRFFSLSRCVLPGRRETLTQCSSVSRADAAACLDWTECTWRPGQRTSMAAFHGVDIYKTFLLKIVKSMEHAHHSLEIRAFSSWANAFHGASFFGT